MKEYAVKIRGYIYLPARNEDEAYDKATDMIDVIDGLWIDGIEAHEFEEWGDNDG